jgi:ABC-type nitrate/sulfonate/bicarbonate transport system ATPase subunit
MTAAAQPLVRSPLHVVAASREPLIEISGVGHSYVSARGETTRALGEVSLSVADGEFVCLLGPSGCGKTTLLNMIAGFVAPTAGTIRFGGEAVEGPSPQRGVVFQDYSLFPWLTVAENVAFGPRMARTSRSERSRQATELLDSVGLKEAARRYPSELSGGMKQRVAIARALATDPRVLLMDEPFAALDAMTRGALQAQLLEIHAAKRKTVIFVTHNIAEAIALATRIVVLTPNPGRIAEDIPVDLPLPRRRTSPGFAALYERLARSIGVEGAD